MARTTLALSYLGSNQFPLDIMITYPRVYIRHVFKPGDLPFDITNVCSAAELQRNSIMADLLNPARAGGALFSIIETPGSSDIPGSGINPLDASGMGTAFVMRVPLVAGGAAGTPDDVTVYASVPKKMRIIDSWAIINVVAGGSSVQLRDTVGGAGNALSQAIGSAVAGMNRAAGATPVTTTASAYQALVTLRRSDRSVTGELFILVDFEQ